MLESLFGEDAALRVLGPPPLAGKLRRLVLDQPAEAGTALGQGELVERAVKRCAVDLDGLVGPGADPDLGEAGSVDANPVGGQDAVLRPIGQPDVEPDDGVARVDSLEIAVAADPGGQLPGRRRRRGTRRGAARAGREGAACRRPVRTEADKDLLIGLVNGQRTAPTAATASSPVSPVAPALISSTVGRRPPIRTIAITRPRAWATLSGCSVGFRVTTGIWSLGSLMGIACSGSSR